MTGNFQKLIIDTDAGVDDAIAIMMALAYPTTDVIAITTVNGNVDVEKVTRNVAHTLDLFENDVPIYRGCSHPLIADPVHSDGIHGSDGLGVITASLSPGERLVESEAASLALVRLAKHYAGQFTLVALGPLTNLAVAVRLDPGFVHNVKRLVLMGGAVEARGNASPAAEFNIYADPEAAAIVFGAGFPDLWMLSWEATLSHPVPWSDYDELAQLKSGRAEFFRRITMHTATLLREGYGYPGFLVPDPLAAAVALNPDLIIDAQQLPVSVEIVGEHGRGLTSVDWFQQSGKPASAHIVQQIDMQQVVEMMRQTIAG